MTGPVPAQELHAEAWLLSQGFGLRLVPAMDKKPALLTKPLRKRPPGREELRRGFARPGVDGIALLCGLPSDGTYAIDFDDHDRFAEWRGDHPDFLFGLPVFASPRGGQALFRSWEPLRTHKHAHGEVRGEDSITIIPPSWHRAAQARRRWIAPPSVGIPYRELADAGLAPAERKPGKNRADPKTERIAIFPYGTVGNAAGGVKGQPTEVAPEVLWPLVEATLPDRAGVREERLWQFARLVRNVLPADADESTLVGFAWLWWARAFNVIGTKGFGATATAFVRAFRSVKYAGGPTLPGIAAAAQDDSGLARCFGSMQDRRRRRLVRLAGWCRAAAIAWAPLPFPCSARMAARLVESRSADTGHGLLCLLAEHGLIRVAAVGAWNRRDSGESSKWFWTGPRAQGGAE